MHQQTLQRRRQQRSMTREAQQQDHPSKDTPISRGREDKHSTMQQSSPSALATQQTDVRTEQNTSRNTITSQAVSDSRHEDIITEPARLAATGNRPIPQVPPRATGLNTTGGNILAFAPRHTSKRILADLEVDRAATEITNLVEQEGYQLRARDGTRNSG